jgi:uncharacterized protein DUF4326
MPERIQRKRVKDWKAPDGVINVTRPGRYGNPYFPGCGIGFGGFDAQMRPVSWPLITKADMKRHFAEHMRVMALHEPKEFEAYIAPLRGKNLMCWCKPGEPCHGDVLLELAAVKCEETVG